MLLMKFQALCGPLPHHLLSFVSAVSPYSAALSVNGLDYELLQAHGLLLGQKTPSIVWGMAFVLLLSPGNIRAFPFKAAIPWQVVQQLR